MGLLDLLEDGSTVGFNNDPPMRRLEPGYVVEHRQRHDFRLPVHRTTLCIRRELAVALGGWMEVPGSDDTGLLVAASVTSVGYFHPKVGLLYRNWASQATASTAHSESTERTLRMRLIDERAKALEHLLRRGIAGPSNTLVDQART